MAKQQDSALEELGRRESWILIWRLVYENARDKWKNFVAGMALLIVVSVLTGASAYMMEPVINEVFVNKDGAMVWVIAGAIAAIFLLKGLAAYGSSVILAQTGNAIVARLQRRMFDKVVSQGVTFFEENDLGPIVMRFQASTSGCAEAINTLILSIGRDGLTMLALIGVMIIQDPLMSVLSLTIGPPAVMGVMYLMRQVKQIAKSEFFSMGALIAAVKETHLGIRVVKTFRLQDYFRGEIGKAIDAVERRKNGMAKLGALTVPLMETLGGIAIAMVVVYGGTQVVSGNADPGSFFSFITALIMAYEPARRLARFNVQFQKNMIGVRLCYGILDTPDEPSEDETGPPLKTTDGEIVLDRVAFSYDATPVLHEMSLTMPPRKVTALVGPSGGGKSTIFSLITRLRQPTSGTVLIDGTDIAGTSAGSVRGAISYVSQDAFLFQTTVRENIRMGKRSASDEEVEQAARAAHAHEFIERLAEGYDSDVGEGGNRLSGGQRQRIAIARAMLADAPILLLDEATSALDSVSEQKVQDALERLMAGRTTVVIAHRLSTVRNAAVIHVIEDGHVVESGRHEDLVNGGGLYAKLHAVQFRDMTKKKAG